MGSFTTLGVRTKNRRVFFGPAQTWANPETGETIEVVPTTLTGADTDFQKFWIGNILAAVDELSNAKMKVVWYILSRVDRHTNELRETVNAIAAGSKVSRDSVLRTLKVLEDNDIIRRRLTATSKAIGSYIFLNPDVLMTGPSGKRRSLLIRFQQLELPMHNDRVVPIRRRRTA